MEPHQLLDRCNWCIQEFELLMSTLKSTGSLDPMPGTKTRRFVQKVRTRLERNGCSKEDEHEPCNRRQLGNMQRGVVRSERRPEQLHQFQRAADGEASSVF